MTPAERRAKCILSMAISAHAADVASESEPVAWYNEIEEVRAFWIKVETAAFDSIHGIARVNTIEATYEMMEAGQRFVPYEGITNGYLQYVFIAMSAAGDLTNQPEKKP